MAYHKARSYRARWSARCVDSSRSASHAALRASLLRAECAADAAYRANDGPWKGAVYGLALALAGEATYVETVPVSQEQLGF